MLVVACPPCLSHFILTVSAGLIYFPFFCLLRHSFYLSFSFYVLLSHPPLPPSLLNWRGWLTSNFSSTGSAGPSATPTTVSDTSQHRGRFMEARGWIGRGCRRRSTESRKSRRRRGCTLRGDAHKVSAIRCIQGRPSTGFGQSGQ